MYSARFLIPRRCFSQSPSLFSGHNKWSKIKQKKGATDLQKSAIYGKASRDIVVAARSGGSPDPQLNKTLETALLKAKMAGVPKDNIEKALARATGGKGKDANTHVVYEAMVSGNVGILVECLTDNTTRTNHDMRNIIHKYNGRYASVAFLFEKKGCIRLSLNVDDQYSHRFERLFEAAVDADAEDVKEHHVPDGPTEIEIICPPQALTKVTNVVSQADLSDELLSSELIYRPCTSGLEGAEGDVEENVGRLVEALEDNEDCLRVWTTLDT